MKPSKKQRRPGPGPAPIQTTKTEFTTLRHFQEELFFLILSRSNLEYLKFLKKPGNFLGKNEFKARRTGGAPLDLRPSTQSIEWKASLLTLR